LQLNSRLIAAIAVTMGDPTAPRR